ncbi:MAG: outer membrane protein assembly factor BamD [Gammaproteobacteria bacterium]|nr:outer membrane protein assembly factor BamD [Gammaproteobacteria bacterium]
MKNIKSIIILLLALVLIGCAAQKKGIDAYQGQTAKQIFATGKQKLVKADYTDAVDAFEALDALYPFGNYSEPGLLNLLYAYYMDSDYAAAAAVSDRYIHLYPSSKAVDYAYYMRGMSNFEKDFSWFSRHIYAKDPSQRDLSSMRAAFVDFNELIASYPKSKYVLDAQMRMIYIRDLLAKQEVQIAKFYMDYYFYVAAANRASYVVEHFQGSPQVKEALKVMIASYTKLGDTKQANDAVQVFRLNYPHDKLKLIK